jgi:hypothetical protein
MGGIDNGLPYLTPSHTVLRFPIHQILGVCFVLHSTIARLSDITPVHSPILTALVYLIRQHAKDLLIVKSIKLSSKKLNQPNTHTALKNNKLTTHFSNGTLELIIAVYTAFAMDFGR